MALHWTFTNDLTPKEERLFARLKKKKIFTFLRLIRHQLFSDDFQKLLTASYPERLAGEEPVPPALLAMAFILQAALHVSDAEAARLAEFDMCWRMVLGGLDSEEAPFSQASLVNFRHRLIAHDLDAALLTRTVGLAKESGLFGDKALRLAFDSSPLFGAGRVEDTFNLLGHAARQVLQLAAKQMKLSFEEVSQQAGITLLNGKSLKATLDINWDSKEEQKQAMYKLVAQLDSLGQFVTKHLKRLSMSPEETENSLLQKGLDTIKQIMKQDLECTKEGHQIKEGTAKDRRVSITDPEMRHGHKSKSMRFEGFKRHVGNDLESGLIVAVAITPANRPESEALKPALEQVTKLGVKLAELDIDRAYLSSPEVKELKEAGVKICCKAFPLKNGDKFSKAEFVLDFEKERVMCPAGQVAGMELGKVSKFGSKCVGCPLRAKCTSAKNGRSLSIHKEEPFMIELRTRQKTAEGREELRERVGVEHALAQVGQTQGKRARYKGTRKNLMDLRRHAAVYNLYELARAEAIQPVLLKKVS
jgi:IS5 family transposase